jgi:hypothetical protein
MRRVSGLLVWLPIASPLLAIEAAPVTANVYVNAIGGFGTYLTAAFQAKGVPLAVVADRRAADFEIVGTAESKEAKLAQAILINQGGTNEHAAVSMINLKNGKVVFAYTYSHYALFGRQSAAQGCAKHLRTALQRGEIDLRAALVGGGHHAGETTAVPPAEPETPAGIPPSRQLLPVAIASDPAGARIEINGIFTGTTPMTTKLQPGEYYVGLILAGYEIWNGKIQVRAGTPGALAAALKSAEKSRRKTIAAR